MCSVVAVYSSVVPFPLDLLTSTLLTATLGVDRRCGRAAGNAAQLHTAWRHAGLRRTAYGAPPNGLL